MSNIGRKTITAALAALTIGLGVAASTAPAAAQHWHGGGGGWHGGGGGWHGGGGWRGGGWHGGGWGPGIGLGIVGGLAAGAIIASQAPYYGYGYGYGGCIRYRPMYDQWGNYLGQRAVNVCY